jgi:hypothetical protein
MMSSKKYPHDLKLIVGYTTSSHLCLDLDDTSLAKVIGLVCQLIYDYPDLGKCQIMQSSPIKGHEYTKINRHGLPRHHIPKPSYHLIFDNNVGYKRCWEIIQTLIDLGIQPTQVRQIRARRRDMTLRVSPMILSDTVKDAPVPIMQILNIYNMRTDGMIKVYHKLRHATGKLFGSVFPLIHA